MVFKEDKQSLRELRNRVKQVQELSYALDEMNCQEQFDVLWRLAFVDLQTLEDYRILK